MRGRRHTHAAILSVGDELMLGQTLDTNSRWLSARLLDLGVRVVEHATVPDDRRAQGDALRRLAGAAPLVIATGGLGPTQDDLTRIALADAMGEALVEDAGALASIASWFTRSGRVMPETNRVQALRPASARMLANARGTAPGLAARITAAGHACDVFCLPGPPGEMRPMFEASVATAIRPPTDSVVLTRGILTFGMGESTVAERLGALMARTSSPLVGTTASDGVVTCRIRYEGPGPREAAQEAVDRIAAAIKGLLGPVVFGEGGDTLAGAALDALRARGATLATVESCTGGALGAMLTSAPGSSDAYLGGWVTYTNAMKTSEVGVDAGLIEARGAVSRTVAESMALGGLRAIADDGRQAAFALSITGVAGPGGGSEDKPVGTVWIGLAQREGGGGTKASARRFLISGDRETVRRRSAQSALAMLRMRLLGADAPLLWEQPGG